MKFTITNVHRTMNEKRNINSLEELQEVIEELHPGWHNNGKMKDVIINFSEKTIVIYDDYIE